MDSPSGSRANSAFHQAIRTGKLEAIKSILRLNLTSKFSYICRPLSESEKASVVNSVSGRNAWTALLHACQSDNPDLELVSLLLENGANINAQDPHGRTPLQIACRNGKLELVYKLLNEKNINVNLTDQQGRSPLLKATQYNYPNIVSALLSNGADATIAERQHLKTPLHEACQRSFLDCFKLLLSTPGRKTQTNIHGNTPLHICCIEGNEDFVKRMLSGEYNHSNEPCLRIRNTKSLTPLDIVMAKESQAPALSRFVKHHFLRYINHYLNTTLLTLWTKEDVGLWLDSIGLSRYTQVFIKNNVTGAVLNAIQVEPLKEMNVTVGDRVDILTKIQNIKKLQFPLFGHATKPKKQHSSMDPQSLWYIDFKDLVIGSVVGKGFFGEVRKATFQGCYVAVKFIYKKEDNKNYDEIFQKEIEILSSLRHPNIINFMGFSLDPQENSNEGSPNHEPLVMVTEFMGGGTLDWVITNAYKEIQPRNKNIIIDIVKGMTYLHSRNILHRDLNTKNILLDEHYDGKISDFGLSKITADKNTMNTTAVGFLGCMAPEGNPYSFPADVYSFAIVLYQLLTGIEAYHNTDIFKYMHMVAHEDYRPQIPATVSAYWARFITSCWHSDPLQRPKFQTILAECTQPANSYQHVSENSFFVDQSYVSEDQNNYL